jgi:hypothetical protein
MKAARTKLTRKEQECATAQRHHDEARELGKPWYLWKKAWPMRDVLVLIAALALGCGSAQHAMGPGPEALMDGSFPPPLEDQRRPDKAGRCTLPKGWHPETDRVITRNGGCWVDVKATEAECREAAKTNPYNVWYQGRCWYWLPGREKERQPTSLLIRPEEP